MGRLVMEIGVATTAAGLLLANFEGEPSHVYVTLGMLVGAGTTFTGYTCQALSCRTGSCGAVVAR